MLQKFCTQKNWTKIELVLIKEQLRKKHTSVKRIEMIVKELLKNRISADDIRKMIQLKAEREELIELNSNMKVLKKKLGMINGENGCYDP